MSDTDSLHSDSSPSQPTDASTRRFSRRLAAVVAAFIVTVIAAGVMLCSAYAPTLIIGSSSAELSEGERFDAMIQSVLDGKSTQLYIADFEVDDAMLGRLPIESLRQAQADALKKKFKGDESSTAVVDEESPTYNDEGKRIRFDPPAWQDYPKIDTVLIDQGIVNDEGLAKITELPDLAHIRLRLSPITDAGVRSFGKCDSLWLINLPHSRLTKDGIRSLAGLPKLRQLRLGSSTLTNDCCYAIAELTGLRGLHLIGVPITDDGVKVLCQLPHLESLYLDDSAVTDAGWNWVFRNHPQIHVHINQRHHDRDPKTH